MGLRTASSLVNTTVVHICNNNGPVPYTNIIMVHSRNQDGHTSNTKRTPGAHLKMFLKQRIGGVNHERSKSGDGMNQAMPFEKMSEYCTHSIEMIHPPIYSLMTRTDIWECTLKVLGWGGRNIAPRMEITIVSSHQLRSWKIFQHFALEDSEIRALSTKIRTMSPEKNSRRNYSAKFLT